MTKEQVIVQMYLNAKKNGFTGTVQDYINAYITPNYYSASSHDFEQRFAKAKVVNCVVVSRTVNPPRG